MHGVVRWLSQKLLSELRHPLQDLHGVWPSLSDFLEFLGVTSFAIGQDMTNDANFAHGELTRTDHSGIPAGCS
jgi:hypothetical protein